MDRNEAREVARRYVNAHYAVEGDWLVVLDEHTIERPYGWVFFYDSHRHQETGDFSHALAGNGPIVVMRDSGEVFQLGTARPTEDELADFESQRGARWGVGGRAPPAVRRQPPSPAMAADVRELLARALQAIDGVSNPEDFPSIRMVRAELADMLTYIEAHGRPERPPRRRGLGRLVTDSWPLNSDVGTAVIAAEMAYEERP